MIEAETVSEFEVQLRGETILVIRPDHTAYSIVISNLTEIYVETNNEWGHDLWMVLIDEIRDNGVTFPLGAIGETAVFEALHKLRGFAIPTVVNLVSGKQQLWSKFKKAQL